MQKQARRLENGDEVEIEQGGTRILCEVVRAPEKVWMPLGVTNFWVREKVGYDLHLVSCSPDHLFDIQEGVQRDMAAS